MNYIMNSFKGVFGRAPKLSLSQNAKRIMQSNPAKLPQLQSYPRNSSKTKTSSIFSTHASSLFHNTKNQYTELPSNQNNPTTTIVLTPHPTNLNFNYNDRDGKQRRPYLWEEVDYYYNHLAKSNIPENTKVWIGYDMDRHQDEQENIFTYTFLQNLQSTLIRNNKITENDDVYQSITQISSKLRESFKNKTPCDVINDLHTLKTKMDELEIKPSVLKGQYRIGAEDLASVEDRKKIGKRLQELSSLSQIFGIPPVTEVIIADCTNTEEIDSLNEIIQECDFKKKLNVIPLIEETLAEDTLQGIIEKSDQKVMLAGSDSIQRETYIGAMLMKIKIQKLLNQYNQDNPDNKKTFFEGVGSTVNRNGCMLSSRNGVRLKELPCEITIQGMDAEQYIADDDYRKRVLNDLNTPRCSLDDLNKAETVLQKVYDNLSNQHKELQNDDDGKYTALFNENKVFNFVKDNSHYGSRAKPPKHPFHIKEQRAITQSMIHNRMHFQPEMMYWDRLLEDGKIVKDIKENINNPLIKDFLNQYTALYQGCDLNESKKWIQDDKLYENFKNSYNAFGKFLSEIKNNTQNIPKDLLLNNLHNHKPRLNYPPLSDAETRSILEEYKDHKGTLDSNSNIKKLHHHTGAGYSTTFQRKEIMNADSLYL